MAKTSFGHPEAHSVVSPLRFVSPSSRGCVFSCLSSPHRAEVENHPPMHACTLTFLPQIFSQSEPGLMEHCRPQVSTLAFLTKTSSPNQPKSDGASSAAPVIQPKGVDKEGSIAFAVAHWRPEAAVQECRASGDVGVDRQLRCGGRNSNFTLSTPPDRTELENLEVSATFRMGGRTQPLCPLHRVFAEGGSEKGTEVRAYPAAPPRSATRATPIQMLQCRNLRARTLVSHRVPAAPTLR